jgi:hypothetical protein
MKGKSLLIPIILVLAIAFIGVAAASAESGQATLTIINYVGKSMIFTLDDVQHTVPGTDTAPAGGRLDLTLSPGHHTYNADVPGADAASGDIEAVSGQALVWGVRLDRHEATKDSMGNIKREPYDVVLVFPAALPSTAPAPAAGAAAPPAPPAPVQVIPANQGALVVDNYVGEDLHIDLRGTLYTIPADGRLQINLDPGVVSYSASVATSSLNGQAQITAGQYTGLGFSREILSATPVYEEGKPAPTPVPLKLYVQPVTITAPAAGAPAAAPTTVPPEKPGGAVQPPAGTLKPGLTVTNYVGEPLTFTINNQTYTIAASGGTQHIALTGGEYAYTASIPSDSANGSFVLAWDQALEMSVAYDVAGGHLQVYLK